MNKNAALGYVLLLFLIIPFLPREILMLTDYLVVRVLMLIALVSVAYVSPVVAVLALAAFAFVFIQRNRLKMIQLSRAMRQSDESSPAIQGIATPETAPPQPPFEVPEVDSVPFAPQKDSGDDSFAPVAPSQDEKQPLPTESADGSRFAIQELFEWVNPNLAQSP